MSAVVHKFLQFFEQEMTKNNTEPLPMPGDTRKGLGNTRERWAQQPNATEGSCSLRIHHLSDRLAGIAKTIFS